MGAFFRVLRVERACDDDVCAYWVESTAMNNVDDPPGPPPGIGGVTELPSPGDGVREIAEKLRGRKTPEIAITVHGFNNPADVVKDRYIEAFKAVNNDAAIKAQDGLVCIGYRWPSESMGAPKSTLWSAAPNFLKAVFLASLVCFLISALTLGEAPALNWSPGPGWRLLGGVFYVLGLLLFAVPFAAFLERIVVYFRDTYRAANYGVPDLVELLRLLDAELMQSEGQKPPARNWVRLSFIGHSMGAFVTTNVIRILSDVFDTSGIGRADGTGEKTPGPEIGNVFRLGRLVLVSPDIPAEALMSRRMNFLASSLRRFPEAYLFSNEGDVVLRMVSTVANYFSFPTRSFRYGYRLGNTAIVSNLADGKRGKKQFGVLNLDDLRAATPQRPPGSFLERLRLGDCTLGALYGGVGSKALDPVEFPQHFTYLDCTDYVEASGRGIVTRARRRHKLGGWELTVLLWAYLRRKVDVHSGYFGSGRPEDAAKDAPFTRQLIYRLACLGFAGTVAAMHNEAPREGSPAASPLDTLSAECARKQIQVLLSPRAFATFQLASVRPVAAAAAPDSGASAG